MELYFVSSFVFTVIRKLRFYSYTALVMWSHFLNPRGVNAEMYAFRSSVRMKTGAVCPVIGEKVSQQMTCGYSIPFWDVSTEFVD